MSGPGSTWAVIAGGGTAGHVLPGLSMAREMVARGTPPAAVHFVGTKRGIETRLVSEAGFGLTTLPGRGVKRRFTAANLAAITDLIRALVGSFRLLRRHRPAVVVGLGGYASVACGVAAVVLRVPLVITEQNAVPGAANRLLARWARGVAAGFPATGLPGAVWTGNPVRPEVLAADRGRGRIEARAALGVTGERFFVVVMGGSLGARRINEAVVELTSMWRHRCDRHIRHVTGRRDFRSVSELSSMPEGSVAPAQDGSAEPVGLVYDPVEYEDGMAAVYTAADLIVGRAGASTVAELAATGVPAVLVPLPAAPGDHQSANARALADVGAAVVIPDRELDGLRLAAEIDALAADPQRLSQMDQAARVLARPGAAHAVIDVVERCARRRPPAVVEGT